MRGPIETLEITGLEAASDDEEHIRSQAEQIQVALNANNAGCGREPGTRHYSQLCAQRRVLIALGWLDFGKYGQRNIRTFSVPSIKRLQRALGTVDDGIWGPKTNEALADLLEDEIGRRADAGATHREVGLKKNGKAPGDKLVIKERTKTILKAGLPILGVLTLGVTALILFRKPKLEDLEGD